LYTKNIVMKLQIFDADYTTKEGLEINLYGKNKDGVYKINDTQFKPYFYAVPEENIEDLEKDVKENGFETEKEEKIPVLNTEKVEKTDSGKKIKVLKIVTDVPANVSKLKNEIWSLESVKECREFDLSFYRRYLIDKHIRPGSWVEVEGTEKQSDDFKAEIELRNIKPVKSQENLEWNSLAFDLEVIDDNV